jgi:hypothetical protein
MFFRIQILKQIIRLHYKVHGHLWSAWVLSHRNNKHVLPFMKNKVYIIIVYFKSINQIVLVMPI